MVATNSDSYPRSRPSGITCPRYEALPGRKHCRDYLEGGACARPDEFMCVEWLKVNGHGGTTHGPNSQTPGDLFGRQTAKHQKPMRTSCTQQRPTAARPLPPPVVHEPISGREPQRAMTTDDIDSFKALGVEVCLESDSLGEVWLVPEYTEADRREITPEHTAAIARVMAAFPGAKVVSLEKSPQRGTQVAA